MSTILLLFQNVDEKLQQEVNGRDKASLLTMSNELVPTQ